MLRFIFTLISLFVFTNLYSQSLSGIVSEKKPEITVPYATIVLKNTEGVFVKGTTTNDEGKYLLENLKNDTYLLEVSFIGFKKYKSKIQINGKTTQNIVLEENAEALNEVVITAERTTVEQLIDKKVINVGKDLLSGGGNAKTVLTQLSEVQVTQNGSISLKGNQNVNVLVNGKPSPLSTNELLQQIPAGDIYKIEVITSPSAKYQANGLTGIINIITQKKVRKGTSINSNASINSLSAYAANVNYSYGKSKTNYKLGVSYNKDLFINSNTQVRTGLQPFTQNNDFEFNGGTYRVNTGMDWFPNKFNEFSVSIDYTSNGHTLDNKSEYLRNNITTQQNNFGSHKHNTLNLNTNYRHKFKNESDFIELDVQLSNNDNVLKSNFKPNLNALDNKTDNDVFIANTALDYSGKINDKLQIETGFLWNSQDLNNSKYFLNTDETISSKERFKNIKSTYALYGLIKYNLEKLKIQAGLRGEIFNRKANLITNNKTVNSTYKDLFPSLHFSYLINDHHNLVFGYNRRTFRPSLSQVNPIAYQANEYSISRGNPNLKPEFSNNFDISYTYHTNGFSLSPSFTYSVINDVILTKFTLNDDGVNLYTPVNNNTTDSYALGLSTYFKPLKKLKTNVNFNYNYKKIRKDQINYTRNYNSGYNLVIKNEFKLSKQTNLVALWQYYGKQSSFYYTQKEVQFLELGVRQKVLKNQGTINLRVSDVFNTQKYEGADTGIGFSQSFYNKPKSRVVYLSFSYNFHNGKIKHRNKKQRTYDKGIIE